MPKLNTSILTATDRAAHRQILFVAIGDLIPDPDNPRKHGRAQISAIAKSIEAFGFNAPILVEKNNKIVAGHGRSINKNVDRFNDRRPIQNTQSRRPRLPGSDDNGPWNGYWNV
jgi:ParB-like nuclease domain